MNKKDIVGIVGQYASMTVLTAGILIELIMGAYIGFIIITTGGLLWGISTKLRGK